jgi:hypothetical protein
VPVHKWYSNIRAVDSTLGGLKYKVDNIKIDENLPEETKKTLKAIKRGYSDGIGSYLKAIRIVEDALGNDTDINTKDVYEMQSNFSKGHVALELSSIPLTELHEKYNIDIPNANQY